MELSVVTDADGEDRPLTFLMTDQGTSVTEYPDGRIVIVRNSEEPPTMELKNDKRSGRLSIILSAPRTRLGLT